AKLTAVAAAGTRVYGIEDADTLHVYDGSSPESPRAIGTIDDWVHAIAANGTRLFLAGSILDDEKLPYETGVPVRVYDVTTLASPVVAGELREALGGPVSGVWTDGSIALVVDPPYLRVLDVSKTEAPVEMSSLLVPRIQSHVRARDGKAIIYGRSEVNFIDISDPYQPKFLGTYDSLGHPPSAASFLRDTIVEANEHSGLHVVDYNDPTRPLEVSTRMWHYHDVVSGDDAVYTMQLNTFLVLDVTDRTRIVDRQIIAVDGYAQLDTVPPNSAAPEYLVWRGLDHLMILSLAEDRFNPKEIARIPMASPGVLGTSATSIFVTTDGVLSRIDLADLTAIHETGMRVSAPMQISVAGEKVVVADRYSVRVYGPDTASPPPPPKSAPPSRRRAARH
ncbi:MAG TPA: hypothetical protein VHL59_02760, partial [Thermoanaerobaculia bacterium]|nr:hypothetical protein [Thermoanaerobaculia bacterium]